MPLARDVIFLAEAGEEGTTRVGIQFMVRQHFAEIDAEYCLAEGGSVLRSEGRVRYASVADGRKDPARHSADATGVAGHGSVPLETNAVLKLAQAITAVADMAAADSAERHHAHLLHAARGNFASG